MTTNEAILCELTVVIVLHNSAHEIESCLQSLDPRLEVILVDNASTDIGVERARAARPTARIICSAQNLGFGRACNLGWRATTRPYLGFINPDVRVHANALPVLVHRLLQEPRSIVGPRLLDSSGSTRRSKGLPSPLLDFYGVLPAAARWAPRGWDGMMDRSPSVEAWGGNVPSLEGACFLIRRADLESIGGFDEDFFLYYEEESLVLRLRTIGGGAIYEPAAQAVHIAAHSTSAAPAKSLFHFHRSRVLFYRKLYGELATAFMVSGLFLAGTVSAVAAVGNVVLRRKSGAAVVHRAYALAGLVAGMAASRHSNPLYPTG
jgi:N-acetylglucosaminyl-diphospho-decaprenol L-rhamnosyltransferase